MPPPYVGPDSNLLLLQAQITDLQNQISSLAALLPSQARARINALDGTGLADPSLAWTTIQAKKIAGLQTTVNQVALVLQQQLGDLKTLVTTLQTALNIHLGV